MPPARKSRLIVVTGFALLLVNIAGCKREARPAATASSDPLLDDKRTTLDARVVGPRTEEVMLGATRVQLYRIANQFSDPDYNALVKTNPAIAGYPIRRQTAVELKIGRTLAAVLVDPKTYVPPAQQSSCLFEPGYVLHFEKDSHVVDAVICFHCGDVVIHPGANLKEPTAMTGWGFEENAGVIRLKKILTQVLP